MMIHYPGQTDCSWCRPLHLNWALLEDAIRERLGAGHNDTCGAVISDTEKYPCSCGHDALEAATTPSGKCAT